MSLFRNVVAGLGAVSVAAGAHAVAQGEKVNAAGAGLAAGVYGAVAVAQTNRDKVQRQIEREEQEDRES